MSIVKVAAGLSCVLALALATPALAKKAKVAGGAKGKGVFCEQGGQNAYFPASDFPAKYRNNFVKGRKVRINIPGYGMVACVVY
jgi:hypothetical protein